MTTQPDADRDLAATLTGLQARFIPRLNSADAIEGANGLGDHFRCQLGTRSRVIESGELPGNRGRVDQWEAHYFHVKFVAATWGDVIAQWQKSRKSTPAQPSTAETVNRLTL